MKLNRKQREDISKFLFDIIKIIFTILIIAPIATKDFDFKNFLIGSVLSAILIYLAIFIEKEE